MGRVYVSIFRSYATLLSHELFARNQRRADRLLASTVKRAVCQAMVRSHGTLGSDPEHQDRPHRWLTAAMPRLLRTGWSSPNRRSTIRRRQRHDTRRSQGIKSSGL